MVNVLVHRSRRHLGCALLALLVLVAAFWTPASAEEDVSPEQPCKPHPTKVLGPGCVPAKTGELRDPGLTFPDLVPNVGEVLVQPTFTWDEETQTFVEGPPHLWFDTHAENHGAVALDIFVDDLQNAATSTVSQCVSWTSYVCRERRQIGGFEWHEEHGHFHYKDFASYAVRRLGADGRPDYSAAGLVVQSDKVSFCLVDSAPFTSPPTPPTYPSLCTPTRQGISPGWADIYTADLEGQQLSLEGVTDGFYALVIALDPVDRVYESDDTNNVVEVTIELSNDVTDLRVVEKRWP